MSPLPDNDEFFVGVIYANDQSFYGVISAHIATVPLLVLLVFLLGFALGSVV